MNRFNENAVCGDEFIIPFVEEHHDMSYTIIGSKILNGEVIYDAICIDDELYQISINAKDIELI